MLDKEVFSRICQLRLHHATEHFFFFLKMFCQVKEMLQKAALSIFHRSPHWQFDRPVIIQTHLSLTVLEQSSETKQVTLKVLIKLGTQ